MPRGFNDIVDWAAVFKDKKVKKVDWLALSKLYDEYMDDITDKFYKLTDAVLKGNAIEKIKDELYVAKSVFEDIEDFVFEHEDDYDCGRIMKYVSDRIDGLTELCPMLYSLSNDSAKENAEAD